MPHISRRSLFAIAGLLLVVGVSGCSFSYPFELQGVIKNADDGTPLAGVTIALQNAHVRCDSAFPVTTQADGTFSAKFDVRDGQFTGGELPVWSLVLTKDGFYDETIEIQFQQRPESTKVTTLVVVAGVMRAK